MITVGGIAEINGGSIWYRVDGGMMGGWMGGVMQGKVELTPSTLAVDVLLFVAVFIKRDISGNRLYPKLESPTASTSHSTVSRHMQLLTSKRVTLQQ